MSARPSEDELIARLFAPIAGAAGLDLKDDVAWLDPPEGHTLIVTVDALVGGVHFFPDDPPDAIARKALRVNLSDLASKGAAPLGFLLALALPRDWTAEWLEAFARGLGEDSAHYGCPLMGGDTVSTPGPLTLSITAFGAVPRDARRPIRTAAQPGDLLYVSGTIGDATLGLQIRLGEAPALAPAHRDALLARYLLPEPRLSLAPAMRWARAAMDVSDGLVGDLTKMLKASGAGGRLELARTPFSPAARAYLDAAPAALEIAATGGDDYEVLAAVAPENAQAFEAAAAAAGVPVARIGGVAQGPLNILGLDGLPANFVRASYSHF